MTTDTAKPATTPPGGRAELAPAGLEGVAVAETSIGDVRGSEGFYHYRGYSAIELASRRTFEEVWYLVVEGRLPTAGEAASFAARTAGERRLPDALSGLLGQLALD